MIEPTAYKTQGSGMFNRNVYNFPPVELKIIKDLIQQKIIDNQQLDIVANEYKKHKQDLPSILVSLGFVQKSVMQHILKENMIRNL